VFADGVHKHLKSLFTYNTLASCGGIEVNNVNDPLQFWIFASHSSYCISQILT